MSAEESVSQWLANVKAGNDEDRYLGLLIHRYWPQLVKQARKKLNGAADEEDAVQLAFIDFTAAARAGILQKLENRKDFLIFISICVARRVIDEIRRQNAQIRGGGKVRGDSVFNQMEDGQLAGFDAFIGQTPSPEELEMMQAVYAEQLEILPEDCRLLVEHMLAGMPEKQIAETLEWTLTKLNRKKRLIKSYWEQELKGGSEQ